MQLLGILHQGICRMHDGRENSNYQTSPQGNELGPFVSFDQILILCLYSALLTKPCPKDWKDNEKIIVKIYAGFRRFKLFLLLKKLQFLSEISVAFNQPLIQPSMGGDDVQFILNPILILVIVVIKFPLAATLKMNKLHVNITAGSL